MRFGDRDQFLAPRSPDARSAKWLWSYGTFWVPGAPLALLGILLLIPANRSIQWAGTALILFGLALVVAKAARQDRIERRRLTAGHVAGVVLLFVGFTLDFTGALIPGIVLALAGFGVVALA